MPGDDDLQFNLAVAVPVWVDRMRGRSWDFIQGRGQKCAQHIAEHGDDILYRAKQEGKTATAFNRLAEGLACLSFAPGGVRFLGLHWESKLHLDETKGLKP
jgi:hypothetical protein